ncbi:DUF4430 domain-containing protein [Lysinibacillus agricola]|uniref:DUF4430 domain-containing protein n=1 Tax=Lysinibacillus agricola TaxID=2590012 RepID=A0ABX7ATI3_9BACI|nr:MULTISPECIES: DUF4430 domain-containing protein [Lysinibacillus]QQP13288.1 DUF4430 domain-containing protein [Lysinibacillus agricola]
MKKSLYFLLVSFLALFLTACNIQTVEQFEQMEEQERSADAPPSSEQPEAKEQTPSVENETAEEKQKVEEPESDEKISPEGEERAPQQKVEGQKAQQETKEVKQQPKQEAEKSQEVAKSSSTKTNQSTTKQDDDKQKANTSTTEKQRQPAPKKRTVTIAIRVDTLLKHWDKLDASLQSEKYVPKNGIILKTTTYELLSEKDTVWDVLQRATKEHKIQMEYQGANENIYNSVYVEGINHLYEFSAGELSGWMYKVNGVYPNYGCSQYVLKDGDVIEWNYTVDLGRDLGHYWDGN